MKVTKHGKQFKDATKPVKGKCMFCKCKVEVLPKEIKHTADQRDGDYNWVLCPECGQHIYF